jgi:hypothetical protein
MAVAVAAAIASCSTHGLQFDKDHRVTIQQPKDRSSVTLPMTLRWRTELPEGTTYAVFVNRAPIGPGETLRDLVDKNDFLCKMNPQCPDERWLSLREVYLTTRTSLELTSITYLQGEVTGRGNKQHEATIVALNGKGVRPTEAAWKVHFEVER